jgi:putative tricarboxylic transport membrane protein
MSETTQGEAIGSSAGRITKYFVISGLLAIVAIPSALIVLNLLPNSLSVINLVLSLLNLPLNVLVGVLNVLSPSLNFGFPVLVTPPEAQLYFALVIGFYSLVFLFAGFLGGPGSPREYFGGAALIAVAIFAFVAARDLPGLRGFQFGPGTAPRMFVYVLGALGAAVVATGVFTRGPAIERFHFRGPLYITLSVVLFAWLVRPVGLVIASFLSIMAAARATPEAKLGETILWAAALAAFCTVVFTFPPPFGLGLPMQRWPSSWDLATIIKGLSSFR